MPRSPLPEREAAICRRLKVWREQRGIKRTKFAADLGMQPNSFSNYEYARAPLPYGLVQRIVEKFPLNAGWLATGRGPSGVPVPLPTAESLGESPRTPFSKIFDDRLAADVTRKSEAAVSQFNLAVPLKGMASQATAGSPNRLAAYQTLKAVVREWLVLVPDERLSDFVTELFNFGEAKVANYPPDSVDAVELRRTILAMETLLRESAREQLGIPAAL